MGTTSSFLLGRQSQRSGPPNHTTMPMTSASPDSASSDDGICRVSRPRPTGSTPEHSNSRQRTKFSWYSCQTMSFPSTGGIVLGELSAVELSWLGVSRSEDSQRSTDPNVEDAFAFQMLRVGARWWPSLRFYYKHREAKLHLPYGYHFPTDLHMGYPSTGGVWVLKTADRRVRIPDDPIELPQDWAKCFLAFTMDERCAAMERFGAKFFATVEECPDIPKTLEEGIENGRYYWSLLRKMEDDSPQGYADRWLCQL